MKYSLKEKKTPDVPTSNCTGLFNTRIITHYRSLLLCQASESYTSIHGNDILLLALLMVWETKIIVYFLLKDQKVVHYQIKQK